MIWANDFLSQNIDKGNNINISNNILDNVSNNILEDIIEKKKIKFLIKPD